MGSSKKRRIIAERRYAVDRRQQAVACGNNNMFRHGVRGRDICLWRRVDFSAPDLDPYGSLRPVSGCAKWISIIRLMREIAVGQRPTMKDLAHAPIISACWVSPKDTKLLRGYVYGHPEITDGSLHSLQLIVISPDDKWAWADSIFWNLKTNR